MLDYRTLTISVTTMARLAKMWPGKPVTVGEFGVANHEFIDPKKWDWEAGMVVEKDTGRMVYGRDTREVFIDIHSSSVLEFIHYLYALDRGYGGVMKWAVEDWPRSSPRPGRAGREEKAYLGGQWGFGLSFFDGTLCGRPKPVSHALRFFRNYIDRHPGQRDGGNLEIRPLDSLESELGAGYTYRSDSALFVGGTEYESASMAFQTLNGKPANVMLMWGEDYIKAMATNDALLRLDPSEFVPALRAQEARTRGHESNVHRNEDGGPALELYMLEGEVVVIE